MNELSPVPSVMNVATAAQYIGATKAVMYVMLQRGRLPSYTVGRERRIRKDALDAYIKQQEEQSLARNDIEAGSPMLKPMASSIPEAIQLLPQKSAASVTNAEKQVRPTSPQVQMTTPVAEASPSSRAAQSALDDFFKDS